MVAFAESSIYYELGNPARCVGTPSDQETSQIHAGGLVNLVLPLLDEAID